MNDTINILPCLQETATARKFVRAVGYGKENTLDILTIWRNERNGKRRIC